MVTESVTDSIVLDAIAAFARTGLAVTPSQIKWDRWFSATRKQYCFTATVGDKVYPVWVDEVTA